jgi:small subunit ribosomal protein S21
MANSRTNCLRGAAPSFCPAGIHLCGGGNPAQQGKTAGSRNAADFCLLFGSRQKVRRLAGRDPPTLIFDERGHFPRFFLATHWKFRYKSHSPVAKGARQDESEVRSVEIQVVDNNVEKAIRVLKRKLQQEGLFREMKQRKYYEKPSVKRKRKEKEAQRRLRKKMRLMRND